jgi:hypothetical protein
VWSVLDEAGPLQIAYAVIVPELFPGPVPTKFAVQVVGEDGKELWSATPADVAKEAPPPSSRPVVQDAVALPETTPWPTLWVSGVPS